MKRANHNFRLANFWQQPTLPGVPLTLSTTTVPRTGALLALGACLIGLAASSANAAIIYDTFGPDPYHPYFASHVIDWDYSAYVGGGGSGGGRGVAAPFTFSGQPQMLTSITLDILAGPGSVPNFQIGIYPDAGGSPSLTPVGLIYPNPNTVTTTRQALTFLFSGVSVLTPNTPYWMVMQPNTFAVPSEAYNAVYSISASSYLPNGGFSVRSLTYPDSSDWSPWVYYNGASPVFRLEGVAVPEPGTWALLALGGAVGWGTMRRRKLL